MGLMDRGWTVIMRMVNRSSQEFERPYQDYVDGFGNFSDNFFQGLESIHYLTKNGPHELYIGMELEDGASLDRIFARYKHFSVGNKASGYKLTVGSYIWQASDSSWVSGGDSLAYHNGGAFSTQGSPNPDCGTQNGAWWYDSDKSSKGCHNSLWSNFKRWRTADPIYKLETFVMAIRKR